MTGGGIVAVLVPPPINFDKLLKFWAVKNPLVFVFPTYSAIPTAYIKSKQILLVQAALQIRKPVLACLAYKHISTQKMH